MFWCLVRLATGALCGGLYANPLEMAIQSAVACSEVKDDGLLVLWQLMERVLVWVVSFSLAVEDGFLFIIDKSFEQLLKQSIFTTQGFCTVIFLTHLSIMNISVASCNLKQNDCTNSSFPMTLSEHQGISNWNQTV